MSSIQTGMTAQEKYLFDLQGFLVVRGVLSKDEVREANEAIDAHADQFQSRTDDHLRNAKMGSPLAGDGATPRLDMGGMLGWPAPYSNVYRKLLAHPRLVPYLNQLCGEGYRLDHMPLVIASEKGAEGFSLHGGTINADGNYVPYLAYHFSHGKMYNNLLACSVQLVDHPAGSGGFIVIPGSHKANFPTPMAVINGEDGMGSIVFQPETKAGDIIFFSEGTVHGAAPWNMPYQRRIALYRFAPPTVAYGRAYFPRWPESYYEGYTLLSEDQLAVLEPAYNTRLDRPLVAALVAVEHEWRSQEKKNFDKRVFGTEYF
ncbi:hypothetical protein GUITHDRAFT_71713 [Guillardia theta CCMP2712]|uniref:Phytanoyl-CoA dioxygenase family protein n=1 Tax=Guillardia theta (strain CCMP2712) TaxID=905079 RepID=L1JA15_GUITC|nr:hypothetical protein GUITHDRAFT_71713 [Guillardia theta CCMP2712]EKX44930.1 hypothetical protein GUITHDRAFT_71713 [Guillardia theta CCMP2712]|eukprot:XP_005831910.1 hypothetical protein GUITHDRAFT_71713 [Guillardia theta CCMP2712]